MTETTTSVELTVAEAELVADLLGSAREDYLRNGNTSTGPMRTFHYEKAETLRCLISRFGEAARVAAAGPPPSDADLDAAVALVLGK